jgi:hypothetical protein
LILKIKYNRKIKKFKMKKIKDNRYYFNKGKNIFLKYGKRFKWFSKLIKKLNLKFIKLNLIRIKDNK